MRQIWLVGLGGGGGAILRFLLGRAVMQAAGQPRFPAGTLAVNLAGCLLIGLVAGLGAQRHPFSEETRVFLVTGLLGGFTTFSAFGAETFTLLRGGAVGSAALNILLSVGLGLIGVWAGFRLGAG